MVKKDKTSTLNAELDKRYPKKDRRRTCEFDEAKGRVKPCWVMDAAVEALNYEKRKGILIWQTINTTTGEQASSYFGVRSGAFKNGIIFNHCPFCGTRIHGKK